MTACRRVRAEVFHSGWTAEAMIYWFINGHGPSRALVLDAFHRMPAPERGVTT